MPSAVGRVLNKRQENIGSTFARTKKVMRNMDESRFLCNCNKRLGTIKYIYFYFNDAFVTI